MRTLRLRPGTLPVVMLVIIIVWALGAVLMLTSTLISAQRISNRVGVINNTYRPIDRNLDAVRLSGRTAGLARKISKAAEPLTGQLRKVDDAARGIDRHAKSITTKTGSINDTAKSINGRVRSINARVNSIEGSAGSINSRVRSIGSGLSTVDSDVGSVNAAVRGINGDFNSTLNTVRSIDQGSAGINNNARTAAAVVRQIKRRTGLIRGIVPEVGANARSIAANPLLLNDLDGLTTLVPGLRGLLAQSGAGQASAGTATARPAAPVAAPVQPPRAAQDGIGELLAGLLDRPQEGRLLAPP